MNTKRLRALAQHIRQVGDAPGNPPKRGYGQQTYTHFAGCGTPACVAGHAAALARFPHSEDPASEIIGSSSNPYDSSLAIEKEAAAWLDLTPRQASDLFAACPSWAADCLEVTAEDAATELERLATEAERNNA